MRKKKLGWRKLINMTKDKIDSLNILEQADLINRRAKQIHKKHKTINKSKAFHIAIKEVLGDK